MTTDYRGAVGRPQEPREKPKEPTYEANLVLTREDNIFGIPFGRVPPAPAPHPQDKEYVTGDRCFAPWAPLSLHNWDGGDQCVHCKKYKPEGVVPAPAPQEEK